MIRCAVDTNVPVVANGKSADRHSGGQASISCRIAAVEFLLILLSQGRVVLDLGGEIQDEYRRYLAPKGQPGVGDLFYRRMIESSPDIVERVELPKMEAGEYADFPPDPRLCGFDVSDRKFAALSHREQIPVINATDSDWLDYKRILTENGVEIRFLCGCNKQDWFQRHDKHNRTVHGRRRR